MYSSSSGTLQSQMGRVGSPLENLTPMRAAPSSLFHHRWTRRRHCSRLVMRHPATWHHR
jgi:hypothetical protein